MTDVIHLFVEKGVDSGKKITVPAEGGRAGRSSKNDIVLVDPLLSRHHCRFFFKTGDGLWITDLGSANQTMVNGQPIQEIKLKAGDTVLIGDTLMRVVNDGVTTLPAQPDQSVAATNAPAAATPAVSPAQASPAVAAAPGAPARGKPGARRPSSKPASGPVDLGLAKDNPEEKKEGIPWGPIIVLIELVVVVIALWMFWPKLRALMGGGKAKAAVTRTVPVEKKTLEIAYEAIQATQSNIFRHALSINRDAVISVEIDDLENNRHVRPKEKQMDKDYCLNLAKTIEDSGFFSLDESYEGIQPDIEESWDLSVTIGSRIHRTKVINRIEPDAFKAVRELIEECGKNEFGLEAIQIPTDKLLTMAQDSYLLGQKFYDERSITFGNLASAIKSFKEAEIYLETVEPKPEYYPMLMTKLSDSSKELDEKFEDHNFRAARAIKMREWEQASQALQVILQLIPDRSDTRNIEARKKLLDMENRLKETK